MASAIHLKKRNCYEKKCWQGDEKSNGSGLLLTLAKPARVFVVFLRSFAREVFGVFQGMNGSNDPVKRLSGSIPSEGKPSEGGCSM
jgi:hypothetical protein